MATSSRFVDLSRQETSALWHRHELNCRSVVAHFTSEQFIFEIPEQFNSQILQEFLFTDICSNGFSEISLVYLLYKYFKKISAKFFYCTRRFLKRGVLLSANFALPFLTINKIQIYVISLPNNVCCSLQSFAAIALRTKKL